jgi:hypothetical protein
LSAGLALTCSADNLGKPGTCISSTFSFFGRNIYKSCYFDPYYDSGSLWQGYELCYATIRTGSLVSDKGSPVVEAWTTSQTSLGACADYDGAGCDVFTTNGYTLDDSLSERGYCDASDANCVKCDVNHVEVNAWTGGGWILGVGDGSCESGCGASAMCDERVQGWFVNNTGCTSDCQYNDCNAYAWDVASNDCFSSCSSRSQCWVTALCDVDNVCRNDFSAPEYDFISFEDLTYTVDGSLINGDNVLLSVHWTDDYYLDSAVLESDRSGDWAVEQVIGFVDGWSNFTLNSSCVGDVNVHWRVTANDTVNNKAITPEQSFYVYNPSAAFNITAHLSAGELLSFTGWASSEANKGADNSLNSSLVGDFTLAHAGIGTLTRYGFRLNESLPAGVVVKLSSALIPTDLIILSEEIIYPEWCQSNLQGDECEVWAFIDLSSGLEPQSIIKSIIITSEDLSQAKD